MRVCFHMTAHVSCPAELFSDVTVLPELCNELVEYNIIITDREWWPKLWKYQKTKIVINQSDPLGPVLSYALNQERVLSKLIEDTAGYSPPAEVDQTFTGTGSEWSVLGAGLWSQTWLDYIRKKGLCVCHLIAGVNSDSSNFYQLLSGTNRNYCSLIYSLKSRNPTTEQNNHWFSVTHNMVICGTKSLHNCTFKAQFGYTAAPQCQRVMAELHDLTSHATIDVWQAEVADGR